MGSSSKKKEIKNVVKIQVSPKKWIGVGARSRRRRSLDDKFGESNQQLESEDTMGRRTFNPDEIITSPIDTLPPLAKRLKFDNTSPSTVVVLDSIPSAFVCENSPDDLPILESGFVAKPNGIARTKLIDRLDPVNGMNPLEDSEFDPEEERAEEGVGEVPLLSACANKTLDKVKRRGGHKHKQSCLLSNGKIVLKIPYDRKTVGSTQSNVDEGRGKLSVSDKEIIHVAGFNVIVNDPNIVPEIVKDDVENSETGHFRSISNGIPLIAEAGDEKDLTQVTTSTSVTASGEENGIRTSISVPAIEEDILENLTINRSHRSPGKIKRSIVSLLASLKKRSGRPNRRPIVSKSMSAIPERADMFPLDPSSKDPSMKLDENTASVLLEFGDQANLTRINLTAVPSHMPTQNPLKKSATRFVGWKGGVKTGTVVDSFEETQGESTGEELNRTLLAELRYGKELRQSLERVRILVELVLKRERLKSDQVRIREIFLFSSHIYFICFFFVSQN